MVNLNAIATANEARKALDQRHMLQRPLRAFCGLVRAFLGADAGDGLAWYLGWLWRLLTQRATARQITHRRISKPLDRSTGTLAPGSAVAACRSIPKAALSSCFV